MLSYLLMGPHHRLDTARRLEATPGRQRAVSESFALSRGWEMAEVEPYLLASCEFQGRLGSSCMGGNRPECCAMLTCLSEEELCGGLV